MRPNKKIVYLTIDDGPCRDTKDKLDCLLSNKIPAILFLRGDHLNEFQKDAIHAIKNGFVIGNHSYHHPCFSTINLNTAIKDIKKSDDLIEKIYKESGIKRPAKIFRFPYGDKGGQHKQGLQAALLQLGYQHPTLKDINTEHDIDLFWTYEIDEYRINDVEKILSNLEALHPENKERHQQGEIVLIHDHQETTDVFFKIIQKLSVMPFEFNLPEFY